MLFVALNPDEPYYSLKNHTFPFFSTKFESFLTLYIYFLQWFDGDAICIFFITIALKDFNLHDVICALIKIYKCLSNV